MIFFLFENKSLISDICSILLPLVGPVNHHQPQCCLSFLLLLTVREMYVCTSTRFSMSNDTEAFERARMTERRVFIRNRCELSTLAENFVISFFQIGEIKTKKYDEREENFLQRHQYVHHLFALQRIFNRCCDDSRMSSHLFVSLRVFLIATRRVFSSLFQFVKRASPRI